MKEQNPNLRSELTPQVPEIQSAPGGKLPEVVSARPVATDGFDGGVDPADLLEVPQVQQPVPKNTDAYPRPVEEGDPSGGAKAVWEAVHADSNQAQLLTALEYHKVSDAMTDLRRGAARSSKTG